MKTANSLPPASTQTHGFIERGAGADPREVGASSGVGQVQYPSKWQEVIDNKLIEWGRNPSLLEDDDLSAPSRTTIGLACEVAARFRDANAPPPQRVCTDAEGGIVFERGVGRIFQSIHIRTDGKIEIITLEDSRLRSRVQYLLT